MSHTRLYIMALAAKVWFAFTQFFTGFGGAPLPHFANVGQIVEALSRGARYRPDRRAGALTHPCKVQARINRGVRIGDCEDHAGYWCKGLRDSLLSFEVYMGHIYYVRSDGTKGAHAVTLYRRPTSDEYFWCDYQIPQRLTSLEAWPEAVLRVYGKEFRGAFMFRTYPSGVRGALRFGEVTTFPLQ